MCRYEHGYAVDQRADQGGAPERAVRRTDFVQHVPDQRGGVPARAGDREPVAPRDVRTGDGDRRAVPPGPYTRTEAPAVVVVAAEAVVGAALGGLQQMTVAERVVRRLPYVAEPREFLHSG